MSPFISALIGGLAGGVGVVLGYYWDRLTLRRGWRGWHIDDIEENHAEESN